MSYTTGIPKATQSLGQTYQAIQNNFTNINNTFGNNHYNFQDVFAGKHKVISLPPQSADPANVASEISLYAKGLTSSTALYLKQPSNGLVANKVIQMTKQVPDAIANGNGAGSLTTFTFLPGNLIMITGFATNATNGSTINFGVTLTGFFSIHLTAEGNSSSGSNIALVAQPRSKTATSMVINLQGVNNASQGSVRLVYFTIIGTS